MSVEGSVPFPGPSESKQAEEFERPAAARIGEAAAELVKEAPAIGDEWIGNFETGDGRSVRVWMPTFPRMASGGVGDAICQIEVTYPQQTLEQGGAAQLTEIWNLSTTLELGYTPQVSLRPSSGSTVVSKYEFPGEQVRERARLAGRFSDKRRAPFVQDGD